MTDDECADYCDSEPLCQSIMYGEITNPKKWLIGTCWLKTFAPNDKLDPILITGIQSLGFSVHWREKLSEDCGTDIKKKKVFEVAAEIVEIDLDLDLDLNVTVPAVKIPEIPKVKLPAP